MDRDAPLGLSADEAARRLAADGPNVIVPDQHTSPLRRLLKPFADPMVALLLVAAPTYLAFGNVSDAIITAVAVVPITAVGWALESRAERTLEQLRRLTAPVARVRRDGEEIDAPADALVVGDVLSVREGDVIPVDGVAVALTQLLVDESALTGESLPIAKVIGDSVSAGTTVLSGQAELEATATGPRTRYGSIGTLLAEVKTPSTPLQRAVTRLVRVFGAVALVFCTAVIAVELARGSGWGDAVIAGVSLGIAAIPAEFPMVYTLYLALGAWRLAVDRALVRRLPGVETLGSTTVICTDKTGTLTFGRLDVAALGPAAPGPVAEQALLTAAVLACEPHPFDPLDLAIVAHARIAGVAVDELLARTLAVDHAFDPVDKYLTHVWSRPDGSADVAAKGSLEGILAHCGHAGDHGAIETAHAAFADQGMRVIAVAAGRVDAGLDPSDRRAHEASLAYVGMVAFSDGVRPGVAEALAECRSAGIRVVMITGDHPVTAHAVAEGLGLPHVVDGHDVIATGDDLDRADPAEADRLVATANVFARIRPEQKHGLVQALRRRGEVVAMTGDGINDAPALREADIGVAMGDRGTAVAREAATMVLLDDNFSTIVTAVRDGRRIFDNLQRAFAYLVAFHPPLLLAALIVPFLGQPLLLLPVHLVMLEIVLHPTVSLVFEADPASPDVMQRPPRRSDVGLLSRELWRPLALGVTLAAATIATYLVLVERAWPTEQARGTAFSVLLIGQLLLLLVERSPDRPLWRGRPATRTLVWVVLVFAVTTIATVYVGPLANLLKLAPPPPAGWPAVIGLAALTTLWSEPFKRAWSSTRR